MVGSELKFKAFRVTEQLVGGTPHYVGGVHTRTLSDLPVGDVLIKVRYSALNFKDALSAQGNKGVTRQYPHTPGVDAVGEVVQSGVNEFQPGDTVIATGFDLGMNTDGGFAEYIRVPSGWLVQLPAGISLRQSMVLGTAGMTAALCVEKLLQNGLSPEQGEVLVTGATGGVGVIAVALLAKLGYNVVACTGKIEQEPYLRSIGASSVIARQALAEPSTRMLLKERWAGAVDVAGGELLRNVLSSLRYGSSVACCGLVGSPAFNGSVFPFILRGINLLGVDSVNLPLAHKTKIWERLASSWSLPNLDGLGVEIGLEELPEALVRLQEGKAVGRVLLDLSRPT
ncbi:MAG: YhdH/YhfP family quinone oxidoreductase [Pseudomonadota bacterium]